MEWANLAAPPAKRWAFLAVILLNTLVALFIARQIIAYRHYPFDIDEASHANGALTLWLELRAGDLGGFAREFYEQDFYPPGVDWLKALVFALFGPSALVARLFSLACLYLAVLVIYALCLELDAAYGWLAGLAAAALTLTMQPLLVTSALVMLEPPGLLVSFTLLWSYTRVLKRPARPRLLLTSFLLTLLFLTKYTFGVVMVVTFIVMELSLLLPARSWTSPGSVKLAYSKIRRVITERWLWLFGPFVLSMLAWFGRLDKIAGFIGYSRPLGSDQPWLSTQNLLFYPRSIALHDSPSPLFALVTLAGLFWAAARWRNLPVRLILIYFVIGMVAIMLINHPRNPRFIVTFVPAAHVLTGAMLGWLAAQWPARRGRGRAGFTAAIGALILCGIFSMPVLIERFAAYPSLMEVKYEVSPRATDLARWLQDQIPEDEPFVLVNHWDQFSPQALAWHLGTQAPAADTNFADVNMPAILLEKASPENVALWRQAVEQSGVQYLVTLEGGPWGAPPWPEYALALADAFVPVAQETFIMEQYDAEQWLDHSVLRRAEWEQVKRASRYTLNIKAVVYSRVEP